MKSQGAALAPRRLLDISIRSTTALCPRGGLHFRRATRATARRRARSIEMTSPMDFLSVGGVDMQKILRDRCLSTPHNEVAEQ